MSLKGWNLIRKVSFEYGMNYYLRIILILATSILIDCFGLIFVILNLFNYIQVENSFLIGIFIDGFILDIVIIALLIFVAKINDMFD